MATTLASGNVTFNDGTTQASAGAKSLTASGYVKTAKGLLIQWGTGTTTPGSASTISYPTAFPSSCRGIYIEYTNNTGAAMNAWQTYTNGTTSFTVNVNIGQPQTCSYTWVAFGY